MKIVVLAGGVGGARFVRGVREAVRRASSGAPNDADAALANAQVDVIVNTGDDWWLAGLRIAPDHDSLLYTLSGQNDEVRGWGRVGETERVSAELQAHGVTPDWFTLGDLDLGTHIARTAWLRSGLTPSEVSARLQARWPLGVTLHPATDDEVDTYVVTTAGERLHFQEWWTRHRATLPAARFEQQNLATARPSPGALAALAAADVVLIAPSNPVVSIGTILSIPGMRDAVLSAGSSSPAGRAPIVGVSPIIAGAAVRGMADACLTAIGVETDAAAVARHYGSRSSGGLLDAWLVGVEDESLLTGLRADGFAASAVPLWMRDLDTSATLAAAALAAGLEQPRA
ncbi:2-phospho-L-lactate transferase [Microcella sp.]|uniref:2-phospho-L-lactate transferase n=1 Tax=Microcella sp. TaxID=1913979 RepID=UPI0025687BC1|nr:2-phospho-L-lactate transferase [Microcella sp.]MBX9471309.1 2-phospho-L-lactate transferase [Microcella sp.]